MISVEDVGDDPNKVALTVYYVLPRHMFEKALEKVLAYLFPKVTFIGTPQDKLNMIDQSILDGRVKKILEQQLGIYSRFLNLKGEKK